MKRLADEKVLVLDFGSQYAQLIARRVRQQNVYCEIVRHDISAARIRELAPKGIILSGGPASVYEPGAPKCDPEIFHLGVPVLGICYGMHLACQALGGQVQGDADAGSTAGRAAASRRPTICSPACRSEIDVWMSHGDQVSAGVGRFRAAGRHRHLPGGRGEAPPAADLRPAVSSRGDAHAAGGEDPRQLSLTAVCGCTGTWKLGDFARETVEAIRRRVGRRPRDLRPVGRRRFVGRRRVAGPGHRPAALLHLRRQRPAAQGRRGVGDPRVQRPLQDRSARGQGRRRSFLAALAGVVDPQEKRRSIGHAFIECFADEAARIEGARFLAQGTLYPDVIESGGSPDGPAATIKLHHNVGGLPEDLAFELIEPLRDLFKDEVRGAGRAAGAAGGHRLAASVPRSRPGGPLRRRSDEEAAGRPPRGRRDRGRTKSSRPGCIARPPRRSPCCCRCRASA